MLSAVCLLGALASVSYVWAAAPVISQGAGPLAFTVAEDSGTASWLNWDKRFGGSNHDFIKNVVATTDGGYLLVGRSESNASGDKSEATCHG